MNVITDMSVYAVLDYLNDGLCLLDAEKKIIYWNRAAETISGFSSSEVTGNYNAEGIITHVSSAGLLLANEACILKKTFNDGVERQSGAYIKHKDGRHVYVEIRVFPLWDNDRLSIIGLGEVFTNRLPLQRNTETTPQTTLCDRACCENMLQGRLDTLKKTGITFGLFLIAIDQSQNIADFLDTTVFTSKEYVLEVVRHRVLKAIRGQDRIGLWGTYVLMVITNNIADSNIKAVGERLIKAVCSSDLSVDSDVITPTVSVGATVAGAGDTVTLIIKRADKAMNQSLASGGNRISII